MPYPEWSFLMLPEDHKEVKWLQSWAQAKFTVWGQIIFGLILVGLAISAVGTQISAYYFVSLIWALFITAQLLSSFFKPSVTVTRLLPPTPTAGGNCLYRVILKNTGNKILRNIEIFDHKLPYGLYSLADHPEQKTSVDWLKPKEEVILTVALRTPQRGSYVIEPLLVGTSFPTGLVRAISRVGGRDPFVVFPKLLKFKNVGLLFQEQFQYSATNISSRIGHSNEFLSTRDYREGDRPRDIHWKSSARNAKLIVKEYSEESFVRMGLFLDTGLKRFEKHRCYEKRISLCAGIAEDFYKSNYVVELFLSTSLAPTIEVGQGRDHFSYFLEMLSALEADERPDFHLPLSRIRKAATQISGMILLLKDWDPQRANFVREVRKLNFPVKVIVVRDTGLSMPDTDAIVETYTSQQLDR